MQIIDYNLNVHWGCLWEATIVHYLNCRKYCEVVSVLKSDINTPCSILSITMAIFGSTQNYSDCIVSLFHKATMHKFWTAALSFYTLHA